MASLLSHILSASALFSLGLYQLLLSTRLHVKSSRDYLAKPFHPFLFSTRVRHLPLYVVLLSVFFSIIHQLFLSSLSDPLTPSHPFSSLQSASILFLFILLSLSRLISFSTSLLPLPNSVFFPLAASAFGLQSLTFSSSSASPSFLEAKCESISSRASAVAAFLCLALACRPNLFVADIALAAVICLKGLWVLQTGLSLYVEGFIPEGCHRLLDVISGVEGSTKCDLEESKLRAAALLDLVFALHVMFVCLIVMIAYACVAKASAVRRIGSYEALPTPSAAGLVGLESNHVQMKAFNQA